MYLYVCDAIYLHRKVLSLCCIAVRGSAKVCAEECRDPRLAVSVPLPQRHIVTFLTNILIVLRKHFTFCDLRST